MVKREVRIKTPENYAGLPYREAMKAEYGQLPFWRELIEYDTTETIFLNPKKKQTEDYVSGKFG